MCGILVITIKYLLNSSISHTWWQFTLASLFNIIAVMGAIIVIARSGMLREILMMIKSRSE
jgi:hypothetical protein